MSKDKFTFDDIDDILADFYKSYNEAEKKAAEINPAPAKAERSPADTSPVTTEAKPAARDDSAAFDFSAAAEKLYTRRKARDESIDFSAATEKLNRQPKAAEPQPQPVQIEEKAEPAQVEVKTEPVKAMLPEEEPVEKAAEKPVEAKPEETSPKAEPNFTPMKKKNAGSSFEEFEALFSRGSVENKSAPAPRPVKSAQPKVEAKEEKLGLKKPAPVKPAEAKTVKKAENPLKAKAEKPAAPAPQLHEAPVAQPRKKFSILHSLLSIVFACVSALVLVWVLFNVHPASGSSVSSSSGGAVLKLSDKLDVYMNNMASDALGELSYIKKIYTLQESDTVAPVPNPDGFGVTRDVAVIQDVIKRAAPLLEGQTVTFDPNADFVPDTDFMYYLDDTIMVIAWKEYINERCCTMAEVKIAHGSQLRRKLAEDSYSSSVQYYASDMANASNAVVAINGDFYAFRDLGITVYQRKLYRNNPASVDSCFFTADGDMLFTRAGELMGEGDTQKFIEDNDVVFAVAFGPVLVDNGELQYCESYPIGEINTEYSRSCIGMTDNLHYLLMTINHTTDARPRATINELARYIYSKGVQKAYTLDGGQTAEIVMMGGPINHVDFGYERTVSDIIYFATAIPNEEVQ